MILAFLGAIDIIGAVLLLTGKSAPQFIVFWIGIIILLKGIASVLGSVASGFFLDILGAIDLIVGLSLIFSWSLSWFWWAPLIKGAYSLFVGFVAR